LVAKVKIMSNDKELTQDVLAELDWDPSVNQANIAVEAKAGVVSLFGSVDSFAQKHAAAMATRRVKGVKAVADEIEVRLPIHFKRGDDEVAAAALHHLKWDVFLPRDAIKVTVENGDILLTGEVDWDSQRVTAEYDVRNLIGVVNVVNQITIKPRIETSHIGSDILRALHRSWLDAKSIKVTAHGGKVKLTGEVRSLHERDLAESTAWAAPAVTAVENDLVVV
jgi:osmotically-inducible protein OsmY